MAYTTFFYFMMLIVFFSYVGYIWAKYGVLQSISQSYYRLPKKMQPLFTLFCWTFAIPAIIVSSTSLMFLAGAAICFVGAAAAYHDSMTSEVHAIGARVGVIASQLAVFLNYGMWPLNIAFIVISAALYFYYKKKPNYEQKEVWWIEIVAFLIICLVLGIQLFGAN